MSASSPSRASRGRGATLAGGLGRLKGLAKGMGDKLLGPGPGVSGGPRGGPPRPSAGVLGTSGALPEALGTLHEPNTKTYEPKRID
jgi:hypothetical protein